MAKAMEALTAGASAPDFSGSDEQGKMHRLPQYRGKTLVLCFLPAEIKTSSGRDMDEAFPGLRKKDVFILGVMALTVQEIGRLKQKHPIPFPVVADPEGRIFHDYGVGGKLSEQHAVFVIDVQGKVRQVLKHIDNPRHLAELLKRV